MSSLRWQRDVEASDAAVDAVSSAATRTLQVQSFLDFLFEDVRVDDSTKQVVAGASKGSGAFGTATRTTGESMITGDIEVVSSAVGPSMRYRDALKRETSKPFQMNYTVCADTMALPTRTAPPLIYSLPETEKLRAGEAASSALDAKWARERRETEIADAHMQSLRDAVRLAKFEARRDPLRPRPTKAGPFW